MSNPTMVLIASQVLASSTSSVTFSSIPQTYTDLKLIYSIRCDYSGTGATAKLNFNSDTGTTYSWTNLLESFGSLASSNYSSQTYFTLSQDADAAGDTSNTFTSGELYIPNYTLTTNKPLFNFHALENNSSTVYEIGIDAGLYRGTSAISSIGLTIPSWNFVQYSSFYLYGIKNQ